jgi:hypothetical protein
MLTGDLSILNCELGCSGKILPGEWFSIVGCLDRCLQWGGGHSSLGRWDSCRLGRVLSGVAVDRWWSLTGGKVCGA